MGLTMDIRTCMPYAVNGSCGFLNLSHCSAWTDAVDSITMMAIAERNDLRMLDMMFSF